MSSVGWALFWCLSVAPPAYAGGRLREAPLPVRFGGFIDTYYAFDSRRPPARDRAFTTQPARHNEFNVNLAFVDATVSGERVRGRLALQAGNSVQSNYAGEYRVGAVSGPELSRHLQEAVVGYRVTESLWVDGGVFLSHIGLESWVSRDNWAYTRLLMSDFSPYYQTGVRASFRMNERWSAQAHVINGWQNVSENNENKALGGQLAYSAPGGWSVTYNDFWGQEVGNQGRFFNDLIVLSPSFGRLRLAAAADFGVQRKPAGGGFSKWYAGALLGRWTFNERVAMTGRVERYVDEDKVIVDTGGLDSFRTTAASVNLDVALHRQLLWRVELRHFWSDSWVYPRRGGTGLGKTDAVGVTSLGLTF